MCVDYSDLNRACPKDFYPLPNIDQLIDSTVGSELISFMDAFSGYNQIKLAKEDQTSTTFITHRGVFAYLVVPFGLLNAGATFQRTMDKIFAPQIGRNMSIYVDDMIVKSPKSSDHLTDLKETFDRIRAHSVRLNPAKCSFGLSGGKFLGYLLTQQGIEADPLQVKAIQNMSFPKSLKELQTLTGCIAALRRFIPQSSKRTLPLHESIKQALKSNTFVWSPECEEAFTEIKQFLASPPIMAKADPCEPLKIYLSATDLTTAAVLVKEENDEQKAVYYVSHMLKEAELRYSNVEKMVLSLVMASRKLRHYFQGRLISVMSNQPLRRILHRPDMSGRLAAWTIELSQFNLEFVPRHSVKSQALSDFVAECTFSTDLGIIKEPSPTDKSWTLFTDGSSTTSAGGAGIILTSPEGFKVQQAVIFGFSVTNNEAEYEALIAGLKLASHLEVKVIEIFSDSQLVVKQINGEFKILNERMVSYASICSQLLSQFASWSLSCIDRSANHWADALSKLATSSATPTTEPVYIRELSQPFTNIKEVCIIDEVPDWRTPIIQFIQDTVEEVDKNEFRKLASKANDYCILEGKLYRRALTEPLLRCIGMEEAQVAMNEVHSGICGEHLAGKNMALKILRHGVYWPTIRKDCEEFTKRCHPC